AIDVLPKLALRRMEFDPAFLAVVIADDRLSVIGVPQHQLRWRLGNRESRHLAVSHSHSVVSPAGLAWGGPAGTAPLSERAPARLSRRRPDLDYSAAEPHSRI